MTWGDFSQHLQTKTWQKKQIYEFLSHFPALYILLNYSTKNLHAKKTDITVENKEILREQVVEVAWLKQEHVLDEEEMSKSKN